MLGFYVSIYLSNINDWGESHKTSTLSRFGTVELTSCVCVPRPIRGNLNPNKCRLIHYSPHSMHHMHKFPCAFNRLHQVFWGHTRRRVVSEQGSSLQSTARNERSVRSRPWESTNTHVRVLAVSSEYCVWLHFFSTVVMKTMGLIWCLQSRRIKIS